MTTTASSTAVATTTTPCPAVQYDGVFYAAMHNIRDDNIWRLTIIFASRDVADEWWRAVSTSTFPVLVNNIHRVTPQFYTHDLNIWNFYLFFIEPTITSISNVFRGKMYLVLENDRVGRGITVVPAQSVVDCTSSSWFTIRSKANHNQHWYYDEASKSIVVSDTQYTLFQVSAPDIPSGAVMIGSDDITLVAQDHGFVTPQALNDSTANILGITALPFKFKLQDLKNGRFIVGKGNFASQLSYSALGVGRGWELAL